MNSNVWNVNTETVRMPEIIRISEVGKENLRKQGIYRNDELRKGKMYRRKNV